MFYVLIAALLALGAFFVYIFVSVLHINRISLEIKEAKRKSVLLSQCLADSQMKLVRALREAKFDCQVANALYYPAYRSVGATALKTVDNQIRFYLSAHEDVSKKETVYQYMVTYKRDHAAFTKNDNKEKALREKMKQYQSNALLGGYASSACASLDGVGIQNGALLGFGLMRLPLLENGSIDIEESSAMADCMLQHGFTYFDTAYFYHGGASELAVKPMLTSRYPRGSFLLADKMPINHLKAKEDVARIFEEQLQKTGAGYFDYYLLHALSNKSYETIAKGFDVFSFISEKKAEGKVRKMGFSFHDRPEVLEKILNEHPEVDFVQLQLNYYDWESKDVQARRLYEIARAHGKQIIVMEPIKGGMLATLPQNIKESLADLLKNDSPATLALRFIAGKEGVIRVLSGMSTLEQAKENARCMEALQPLSEKDEQRLLEAAEVLRSIPTYPCTNCRYCLEACPKHVPIPTILQNANRRMRGAEVVIPDAKACIGCGACETRCPQKISIRKILSDLMAE